MYQANYLATLLYTNNPLLETGPRVILRYPLYQRRIFLYLFHTLRVLTKGCSFNFDSTCRIIWKIHSVTCSQECKVFRTVFKVNGPVVRSTYLPETASWTEHCKREYYFDRGSLYNYYRLALIYRSRRAIPITYFDDTMTFTHHRRTTLHLIFDIGVAWVIVCLFLANTTLLK